MNIFSILALSAGAAIALQAAMNAKLGLIVKNALFGSSVAFFVACICTILVIFIINRPLPQHTDIQAVPIYLWFSGGVLAALGVGTFYYLIPKLGVGSMMSYALAGQLIMASVISHYGWFNLPQKPIDIKLGIGIFLLIAGIVLINGNFSYENS